MMGALDMSPTYRSKGWLCYTNMPMTLGYTYNLWFNPLGCYEDKPRMIRKLSNFGTATPSTLAVLAESWRYRLMNNSNEYAFIDETTVDFYGFKSHSGGANILFADGHAEPRNGLQIHYYNTGNNGICQFMLAPKYYN